MLVETPKRAHVANPAAAQLPKSPNTQAFEGVVMYYGYRYYDPETGRWPSRDPIEEDWGFNLYGFVENNGVNLIDVFGLYSWGITYDANGNWMYPHGLPKPAPPTKPVTKPIPDKSESLCCDEKAIAEGKKELTDIYNKTKKEWEDAGRPHKGVDFNSCFHVNSDILIEFSPLPKCWECKLENGLTDPKGGFLGFMRKSYDHWIVVCVATAKDGTKSEEISFDYWADRPAGEDPNDWFRKKFKNKKDPDFDPVQAHVVCGQPKIGKRKIVFR